MSRNDTYLSLCLEQAHLSPLHYRHGCIVVRGGKVIGKGYNDYRSGFNGGAQTTGQSSSAGATDRLLSTGPKPKKSRNKRNPRSSDREVNLESVKSTRNYVAFDSDNHAIGTGGGNLANTPLSMHSEMMAINSALSLSSAIACQGTARSTQWLQKPCFKLPSRSKRQTRLQHLKAYADAICRDGQERAAASEHPGKSHVQQSRFEASATQGFAAVSERLPRHGGGGEEEGEEKRVETSEHRFQQCPPPRSNQLYRVSEGQRQESAAAHERRRRETPESVPVRHSESPSQPPQGGTAYVTLPATTT